MKRELKVGLTTSMVDSTSDMNLMKRELKVSDSEGFERFEEPESHEERIESKYICRT